MGGGLPLKRGSGMNYRFWYPLIKVSANIFTHQSIFLIAYFRVARKETKQILAYCVGSHGLDRPGLKSFKMSS